MAETILVAVAWPYANGPVHQGQFGGAYLPADIFARYHRTAGNRVLMVSGSDMHGTPITVRAEREGRSPEAVAAEFHGSFLDTWERMGISFDLFTSTGTENHARVSQDFFLRLLEHG
ncbi:MAG TPA: class I tRNA ligase family protein, partial [Dehalococcoidia bacterium]